MPALAVVSFNIVCATLGGFIAVYGLVSYLLKEKYYLSEALISLLAGVIFSPHATNLIRPLEYALGDEETLETITLYFVRLVLGVQLVIAGVQLPSRYLRIEWKSLCLLLGPGMVGMWVCTSLLVWAFVPHITFVYALAVGACVTPTDPILSNTIVKGRFADKNIPKELQKIIIAESGTNDGLGYPFLFLPMYLIRYTLQGNHSAGTAVGMWFYETWVYQIVLGVVYGAVVGWLAKETLHWAEGKGYVDRESFLVFAIALALFIVGTAGMIGSDDVLACFIAGNTFTWDDWFRQETLDDSLQPTIDMLLNVGVFIWFGSVCPWHSFAHNSVIPIWRLILLGTTVLLFRRLPVVMAMHKHIHQIEHLKQAWFVGFFGPIGVSAIFYLYISREYLRTSVTDHGHEREDALKLAEIMNVVIWFLVVCSIVVHGLTIPLGKLGFYIPRTLSQALSTENDSNSTFHVQNPAHISASHLRPRPSSEAGRPGIPVPNGVYRIGRSIIRRNNSTDVSRAGSKSVSKSATPRRTSPVGKENVEGAYGAGSEEWIPSDEAVSLQALDREATATGRVAGPAGRSIRFPDETPSKVEHTEREI